MGLTLLTPAAVKPISLSEAKAHLRVDGNGEDTLIQLLLDAAIDAVEQDTHRALLEQTWELTLDEFPSCEPLRLPRPNLMSVESIHYVDVSGVTQLLDPDEYVVETGTLPG